MLNAEQIARAMAAAGFDAWGVVPAAELSDAKRRFTLWWEEGNGSGLDYLGRNVDKRFDASLLFPGAKSVIVGAVSYKNRLSMGYEGDFDCRIASYAHSTDYHTSLREMLREVATELAIADPQRAKICVDSVPLAEKSLARLAGIGWIGRNSLVINPRLGSFMVLGEIVTTEECDTYSSPMEEDGCVGCGRCLLRCPTGAILTNRTLNATLCVSNKTVEQGPAEWGETHGWFFGCEECQSCCPHNATAPLHTNPRFDALYDPRHYDSNFWAKVSRSEAESLFATTPLVRKFKKW